MLLKAGIHLALLLLHRSCEDNNDHHLPTCIIKMGTYFRAFIHHKSIQDVKQAIGKYYKIANEETDEIAQEWRFWKNDSDTIILSTKINENWVAVDLNRQFSLYFHDELLRRISKDLETEILSGYYQSTVGEGRLAKFTNGALDLSISQTEIKKNEQFLSVLSDNWGITELLRKEFSIPNLAQEFYAIDWDSIAKFHEIMGLVWDGKERKEEKFLHLEIKYD